MTKPTSLPLVDTFERVHRNLRIGVTDRCNIRCFYCMPNENVQFVEHTEILRFEEIARVVRALVPLGIQRLRITGGEPLVRRELWKLIELLASVDGIRDIALTTNGILLAQQARSLFEAGLNRLNVSLDSVNPQTFEKIARRPGLEKVLDGIATAQDVGFQNIRINAVSIVGLTESEIVPLARFALERHLELRFIEFMPLDAEQGWDEQKVLTGARVRTILESELGELQLANRPDNSQPAVDYVYANGPGRVGFINPVSEPFCHACDRLRLTSEGQFRNCLFSQSEWDVKALLRGNASEQEIQRLARACVEAKKKGHGIDSDSFQRPAKSMYQIGG